MKINLPFFRKAPADSRREELEQRCTRLVEQLNDIRNAFDMSPDDDTTDALIYEENAVLSRLAALYKQAKEEGLTLEPFERHR